MRKLMGKKVIIAVINDISGDQRIHRIASTLAERDFSVLVIGRKLPHSLPLTPRIYETHRMKLWFVRGKWFYLEYNLRLLFFLLRHRAAIINANDLDTLGACFLASKIKRTELVYDSHEYFTEVPELVDRPFTRKLWLLLEGWIFPRLKKVYTVNKAIASIYSEKYGVQVGVVRNLPFAREIAQPVPKSNILLYQGALNIGRGLELMIEAMVYLPEFTLKIAGRGDIEKHLAEKVEKNRVKNVHLTGFISPEALHQLTVTATLGLSLEEDLGANYRFASPNKVFDYIQAGVPVLVSDLPVMREVVESTGTGEILPSEMRTAERLAVVIREMVGDRERMEKLRENCRKTARLLTWENEKEILLKYYSATYPIETK
ncbi:MAG: glycosyltransferase [Bacteroidia bacterium]